MLEQVKSRTISVDLFNKLNKYIGRHAKYQNHFYRIVHWQFDDNDKIILLGISFQLDFSYPLNTPFHRKEERFFYVEDLID